MKGLDLAYRALSDVYLRGTWLDEAVKRQKGLLAEKGAYRLTFLVVEREFLYEYRISCLTDRAPKTAASILLKMGMALLDEFSLPEYAAVNEIAETAKKVGKAGLCGFVNAVLRRYAKEGKTLYPADQTEELSVRSNRPLWLVKKYVASLGAAADGRLLVRGDVRTHVRAAHSYGKDALRALLTERSLSFEETEYGFYVKEVGALSDALADGRATVMAKSSIEVCQRVPSPSGPILDLCAAPGGKAVFLAEKFGVNVIACDVYPHRVELIKKYAERMRVKNVTPLVFDGKIKNDDWLNAFSVVLADVPCSGFGSLSTNPDVVLHRTEKDLEEILLLQRALVLQASQYVKAGGFLIYATCSDLPSENEDVVRCLLDTKKDFSLTEEKYTGAETDGECYYYAVLRKNEIAD